MARAARSSSTANLKKISGTKRKRLIDEDDHNNHAIDSMFKKIKQEVYEQSVRKELQSSASQESSHLPSSTQATIQVSINSQNKEILRSLFIDNTEHTTDALEKIQSSSAMQSTMSTPESTPHTPSKATVSLVGIRESNVVRLEQRLLDAYTKAAGNKHFISSTNPRELITCMSRMALDYLERSNYNIGGIVRAVAMAHTGMDHESVDEAWRRSEMGEAYPSRLLAKCNYASSGYSHVPELWTTDAEALILISQAIETIGLAQLQKILQWSYKLACRISHEAVFDPNFLLLIHLMRYLCRKGYDLPTIMKALALELRGEPTEAVDAAWETARASPESTKE